MIDPIQQCTRSIIILSTKSNKLKLRERCKSNLTHKHLAIMLLVSRLPLYLVSTNKTVNYRRTNKNKNKNENSERLSANRAEKSNEDELISKQRTIVHQANPIPSDYNSGKTGIQLNTTVVESPLSSTTRTKSPANNKTPRKHIS